MLPDSSTGQLEADFSKSGMASRSPDSEVLDLFPKLPNASRDKHITQKTSICFLMLQPWDKFCCLADCPSQMLGTGACTTGWRRTVSLDTPVQCRAMQRVLSWSQANQIQKQHSLPQHSSQANRIMVLSYSELGTLWHHGVLNI